MADDEPDACDGWDWEAHTNRRETGLVEHVCPHGVGHPNPGSVLWMGEQAYEDKGYRMDPLERDGREDTVEDHITAWGVHGCDGCCGHPSFPGYRESLVHAHKLIRRMMEVNADVRAEAAAGWVTYRHADTLAQVAEFHHAVEQPLRREPTGDIPATEHELRIELIREELEEFVQAIYGKPGVSVTITVEGDDYGDEGPDGPNIVEIADALANLSCVVYGAALYYGIDLNEVVTEVHRSNMSKMDPETGKAEFYDNGKVRKGVDYWPPDIEGVLNRQAPMEFDFDDWEDE